jgi:hypothetical protein
VVFGRLSETATVLSIQKAAGASALSKSVRLIPGGAWGIEGYYQCDPPNILPGFDYVDYSLVVYSISKIRADEEPSDAKQNRFSSSGSRAEQSRDFNEEFCIQTPF